MPIIKSNLLQGLHVAVIGAGPGGLTFAKAAHDNGSNITVIEQAGDPRGEDPGYTDRSFNLTLNHLGRTVMGDARAWEGSTDVVGRAIHNFGNSGEIKYANYGEGEAVLLTSVPRPILRQNLVGIVEERGVELRFRTKALNIEPNTGKVLVQKRDGATETVSADLIVLADGLHSLADTIVPNSLKGSLNRREEHLNYITVMLSKKVCEGLSLHHIHFWRQLESEAITIGLPNKDGSIAALLISRFNDVPLEASPFATSEQAASRLNRDFPQLL